MVNVLWPVLNGRSRKMAARIAELEDQAEQARLRAAKFEKDKMKLQVEIRDISVELEAVNTTLSAFTSLSSYIIFKFYVLFLLHYGRAILYLYCVGCLNLLLCTRPMSLLRARGVSSCSSLGWPLGWPHLHLGGQ